MSKKQTDDPGAAAPLDPPHVGAATPSREAAAGRRGRQLAIPWVTRSCACGCGGEVRAMYARGRPRAFLAGHRPAAYKKKWVRFVCAACGKKNKKSARKYGHKQNRFCDLKCAGAAKRGRPLEAARDQEPSKAAIRKRAQRAVQMIQCAECGRRPPAVKLSRHHTHYDCPADDEVVVLCWECHGKADVRDGTDIENVPRGSAPF